MLSAEAIKKSFGRHPAVRGVPFAVADQTLHALIGPNGAGKTTAFNLLSGPLPAGSGHGIARRASRSPDCSRTHRPGRYRPLVPDHQPVPRPLRRRERPPRRPGAPPAPLRPAERRHPRSTRSTPNRATIRCLGLAGIEQAEAGSLSYGGQRLLDMGLALATAPRVLLLDEPLAGLAAAERERVGALIKTLSADIPVLLVEHDIDRVFRLADRVTVMNDGGVLLDGSVEDARDSTRCRKSISARAPRKSPRAARNGRRRQYAAGRRSRQHVLRQEPHPQRRRLDAAWQRDRRAARPQRRRQVDAAQDPDRHRARRQRIDHSPAAN